MNEDSFYMCLHVGLLGPRLADGRRRCLRCQAAVRDADPSVADERVRPAAVVVEQTYTEAGVGRPADDDLGWVG